MTLTAIIAFLSKAGPAIRSSWPFIKKNWKNILLIGATVWIVICCMSHCGSSRTGTSNKIDTVGVKTEIRWEYADTNAILQLYGFDTLPRYVRELENRKQFRPMETSIVGADNVSDSIDSYIELLANANTVIEDCDKAFSNAVSVRTYGDTLKNDSIEVSVAFNVSGKLLGEPRISYRYTAPYPVITNTITLKETVVVGPFRKIYLEGGAGPVMTWDNKLFAISGSLGLGYTDKKNWSYGLRGTFNQNGYTVEAAFRKSFNVGK